MMNQRLGERDDIGREQVGGDGRRPGILGAPEPDRGRFVAMDDNRLRRIERPAVEAGQPVHVGRVLTDEQVEIRALHAMPHSRAASLELQVLEGFDVGHLGRSSRGAMTGSMARFTGLARRHHRPSTTARAGDRSGRDFPRPGHTRLPEFSSLWPSSATPSQGERNRSAQSEIAHRRSENHARLFEKYPFSV